ncbi:hypothetical protein HDV57DRAFT_461420 [Trichoderma longibrachiatum]
MSPPSHRYCSVGSGCEAYTACEACLCRSTYLHVCTRKKQRWLPSYLELASAKPTMNAPGTPILGICIRRSFVGVGGMWPANQRLQTTLTSAALLHILHRATEYGIREHSCHALEAIFGPPSGTDFVFPLFVWVILRLCLPSCTGTLAWQSQLDDSRDALPAKICSSWHRNPINPVRQSLHMYHEAQVSLSVFRQGLRIVRPMCLHVAPGRSMQGLSSMLPLREQPKRNSIVRYLPAVVSAC